MGTISILAQSQKQEQSQPPEAENFTCEICIEPMSLSNTLFNSGGKCSHPFCADCMIKYIQAKIEDEIAEIRCPALNCNRFLDPLECQGLVGPELFMRWRDLQCVQVLTGFSRSHCPNRNCLALIVDECGTNVKEAVCPECKYPFCFQCKVPWHTGVGCEETGDENDRAFRQLAVEKNWKSCPRCHLFIERTEGCQYVKCRCKTSFCHDCGQKTESCRCGNPAAGERLARYFVGFLVFLAILYVIVVSLWCVLKSPCGLHSLFQGKLI